MSIFQI
jgi:Bardet-Biedl syndrome 9 protein